MRNNPPQMRLAPLIGPDLQDAIATGPEAVREAVSEFHPEDIAELLEDLSAKEAVSLVRALPTETAADVVERLSPHRQVLVFNAIDTSRAVDLLREMAPDDRVDLLQELEEDDAKSLLSALERREPEAAEEVRELVHYEPETAGGLMTTEFASLPPDTKVWEAMEAARGFAREEMAEMLYYIYVCEPTGKLLGVVSLYLMQDIVHRTFGRFIGWIFVFVISAASSFGIYIGRFVRLNSWDILQDPAETAMEILGLVIDPTRRLAAFTFLYTFFFLFVYLLLYSFSHMLQEQNIKANSSPEQLETTRKTNVKR